jgi:hypothetical protein
MTVELTKPCAQCPWRTANQGKRHFGSFYSKKNLTRLWRQVRGGGNPQSCHLTDPSHPDHIAAGAREDSKPRECPGSVILIARELRMMEKLGGGQITVEGTEKYWKLRKRGLTKKGVHYWLVQRVQFGHVPMLGGPPLPKVDENDPEINLPKDLAEDVRGGVSAKNYVLHIDDPEKSDLTLCGRMASQVNRTTEPKKLAPDEGYRTCVAKYKP